MSPAAREVIAAELAALCAAGRREWAPFLPLEACCLTVAPLKAGDRHMSMPEPLAKAEYWLRRLALVFERTFADELDRLAMTDFEKVSGEPRFNDLVVASTQWCDDATTTPARLDHDDLLHRWHEIHNLMTQLCGPLPDVRGWEVVYLDGRVDVPPTEVRRFVKALATAYDILRRYPAILTEWELRRLAPESNDETFLNALRSVPMWVPRRGFAAARPRGRPVDKDKHELARLAAGCFRRVTGEKAGPGQDSIRAAPNRFEHFLEAYFAIVGMPGGAHHHALALVR